MNRQATLGFLAVIALGTPVAMSAQEAPRFERAECNYQLPANIPADIVRECGQLVVPESRERPQGRKFRLAVVIYRAQSPDGTPPLLLLHGGPGGIGGTRFPWAEMLFPSMRRRDVIAFDNRGVGVSEPQFCRQFEAQAGRGFLLPKRQQWEEEYRSATRTCVVELDSLGLDRTAYGEDINALDAIDLRRALNIRSWDLLGVSYGTLVAQELMRLDSAAVRASALISGVPPGPANTADRSLAFQHALERVAAGCARQPECHRAFPAIEADFYALYEEFTTKPIEVAVVSTPPRTVLLNGERFLMEVRREVRPPGSRRLPLLLHELRRGDRNAAARRLIGDGVIAPWDPLGRIVQCNEYGAGYRAAVAATLPHMKPPFRIIADEFREHCDLWVPNLTRQADTRPVKSGAPTLVIHGEHEATDVPGAQRRMTAGLSKAYVFTFPGNGHAGPPVGCYGSIIEQFVENPLRAPDASCMARVPAPVFSIERFGPTVTVTVSAAAGVATPFAGTWDGLVGQAFVPDWIFDIENDGNVVRGTLHPQGLEILDGKIDGSTMSFSVMTRNRLTTVRFTGRVQGDSIEFAREVESTGGGRGGIGLLGSTGPMRFTVKRVRWSTGTNR